MSSKQPSPKSGKIQSTKVSTEGEETEEKNNKSTISLSSIQSVFSKIQLGFKASILDLIRWSIFSVAMVLLPLVIFHLEDKATLKGIMNSLMEGGNLLIIAIAIIGEGLSEIFTMSKTSPISRVLVGGIGLILMVSASMLISNFRAAAVPSETLKSLSSSVFWLSLVVGGLCKIIKETN